MPILAIRNEIEVELTHKCNWNCKYCAIHVHSLKGISTKEMLSKVQSIKNNSDVTLSGGEPGCLSRSEVEKVINILEKKNCNLYLNTNGLFLKKFPDLINIFKEIIYHCSEDLSCEDEIIKIPNANNIRYMIIVHDENLYKLDSFLNEYKDIKCDIVEATYNKANDGPELSKKNKYSLLVKYKNRMTKESIKRMISGKDFDIMKFL